MPAILATVPLLLAVGGEALRVAFRFDRTGIEAGEWYRLLTGHFTHLGWSHFALNAAGLMLCWLLVGQAYTTGQWLLVIAVCIAVIDLGFWLLVPELDWYVGLSGLLHGMLAAGALEGLRQRSREQALVLAIIVIKVVYESVTGPLPGSEQATGGPVVTEAHLFGMIGGLLGSTFLMIGQRRPAPI